MIDPIVSVDEHTYIYGVWAGPAEGGSVMVTLYRLPDETLLARGRLRVHNDDKLFASADEKHAFQLVAKKGAAVNLFRRRVAGKIRTTVRGLAADRERGRAHVKELMWIPVYGDSDDLLKAMQDAAMKDGRLSISVQSYEQQGDPA
jgi:hypothetical protein